MSESKATAAGTVRFLRRLLPRVRPHHRALWGSALLIVMATAMGLAFPHIVRNLLDAAFVEGDGRLLNLIAVGLLLLFLVQAIVNFTQSYLTASVSERVVARLRQDLFGHLVEQPPGFFERRRVGEIGSRFASDAGRIQDVLRFGLPELIRHALYLVGALVLVTLTHPRLTLVTLIAIPFAAGVGWLFGRRVRTLSTGIQDRLARAVARAEQVFTQIRTVQSFTREVWEAQEFAAHIDRVRDAGLERAVARAALTGAVTFAAFAAVVLVLWEGGRLVLAGVLTPGTLVAFLLYAVSIAGAVTSLAGFWGNLQEAAGAAERVFGLLDTTLELAKPRHVRSLPDPVRGLVRYEDVTFRYTPSGPRVLDGANLEVRPGETVAVVGSSGAGKSTLAALLPRFYDVESGRVSLDHRDVRDVPLAELRGAIGIVPQEPMLFHGSVLENLLYGNPAATLQEVENAARDAHAHDFILGFPEQYEEIIGERGVTLSAGQRQRIAIARVLLKRPAVLILDEASSSLDAESEALVQDALGRLMVGRTTLVIAHRLSTVLSADRIAVLDGGRVRARGTHDELLERSELYARLYRRQWVGGGNGDVTPLPLGSGTAADEREPPAGVA